METINNVAQAAAKAVWGENKEEPVSGKTGDTSKGEPYDAGNIEPRTTTGVTGSDAVKPTNFASSGGDNYTTGSDKNTGASRLDASDSDLKGTSRYTGTTASTNIAPLEDNYDPAGGINKSSGSQSKPADYNSGFQSSTGGASGLNASDSDLKGTSRYTGTTDSTNLAPLEDNYDPAGGQNKAVNTETSAPERDVSTSGRDTTSSSAGPHKEFGSSVKPGADLSKEQQDVRDPSDPQTDPKEAAIKSNVDDKDNSFDKGDNPNKIDGPGPRPIEEVAKEYGGDAGNAKPENFGKDKSSGGDDEDDGDGPQKTSHGEGTGEKYVKSSGLKADGGDFDATKPGAGKEADRLLESKGVHREADKPSATVDDDATDNAAGGHEKKSLGQKIKEKLHKHKD